MPRATGSSKATFAYTRAHAAKLYPLFKHQKKTLALYRKSPIVFDTSSPGTGKTRAALEAWGERRRKGGGCLLVLAPKSLLEPAWAADVAKFLPEFKVSVAYAANREEAFAADADIYVTNIDAVKWLAKKPAKFFKKFDTLGIDESTAFKHRTAQRSKAAAKIRVYFAYIFALTGTPNSNTICDIWHQVYILDGGKRLGPNFWAFRNAVCIPEQVGPKTEHIQWRDKPGAEEAVGDLIRDITIRHNFEECLDIPENSKRSIEYTLSTKLMRLYLQLADDAVLQLEKGKVSAVNAAVLRTKLLQVASGAVYGDSGVQVLDQGRYELIIDLVEEREHSITFFVWKHQKDELIKEAKKRRISHAVIDGSVSNRERAQIVASYQTGTYQTLFIHPKTGAHGLTLTKGTSTIWSSPIYEPDFLEQGKHRIYRAGQTKRTETILIEAKGTIEGQVFERLNTKHGKMMDLLSFLRKR